MASKAKKTNKIPFFKTNMERLLALSVALLLGSVFLLVQKSPSKYVTKFEKKPEVFAETGKVELETLKQKQAYQKLLSMAEDMNQFPWFANVTDYGLVKILDADNAMFTVTINAGEVTVTPGWILQEGVRPSVALEIDNFRLNRLSQIISDGEIADSEVYEVASVALVDVLNSIYQSDVLYFPGDKRILELENYYHIVVENNYGLKDQYGNPLKSEATVVNVDGQWLVFSGLQGKPDSTFSVNIDELVEYYTLINYEFKNVAPQDLLLRKTLLDRYMNLRERTVVK